MKRYEKGNQVYTALEDSELALQLEAQGFEETEDKPAIKPATKKTDKPAIKPATKKTDKPAIKPSAEENITTE